MGTETERTATADKGRPRTGVITPLADASHGYTARLLKHSKARPDRMTQVQALTGSLFAAAGAGAGEGGGGA